MLVGAVVVVVVDVVVSAGLALNILEREEGVVVVVVAVVVSIFGFVASVLVVAAPKLNPVGAVVEPAGLEPKLKPEPDDNEVPRPEVVLDAKLDSAGVDAEVKEEPRVELVAVFVDAPKLNAG